MLHKLGRVLGGCGLGAIIGGALGGLVFALGVLAEYADVRSRSADRTGMVVYPVGIGAVFFGVVLGGLTAFQGWPPVRTRQLARWSVGVLFLGGVIAGGMFGFSASGRAVAAGLARGESFHERRPASYWVKAVGDSDPHVRRSACDALAALGPDTVGAIHALIEGLNDSDPTVRIAAAKALGGYGPASESAVPALCNAVGDSDPGVRNTAVSALCAIARRPNEAIPVILAAAERNQVSISELVAFGADAGPYLIRALPEARTRTGFRNRVLEVLDRIPYTDPAVLGKVFETIRSETNQFGGTVTYQVGGLQMFVRAGPAAVPVLVTNLRDRKAESAGELAAIILTELGPAAQTAAPDLAAVLREPIRFTPLVLKALVAIGPSASPALEPGLADRDPEAQVYSAAGLWMISRDERARDLLVSALATEGHKGRKTAATALASGGPDPRALDALRAAQADPDADIRLTVLMGLWEAEHRSELIINSLKDSDENVRLWAVKALGAGGPRDGATVAALASALRDPSIDIRSSAARSLQKFGPVAAPAVPNLIEMLADKDLFPRVEATKALGLIGPGAAPAVPALTGLLLDQDDWVREEAANALGSIGPDARTAVPVLKGQLQSIQRSSYSRGTWGAARALWQLERSDEAFDLLIQHGVVGVADMARLGIGAEHVTQLTRALDDSFTAYHVAPLLGALGSDARPALPALHRAMNEQDRIDDPAVRDRQKAMFAAAIETIDPGSLDRKRQSESRWKYVLICLLCGGLPAGLVLLMFPNRLDTTQENAPRSVGMDQAV